MSNTPAHLPVDPDEIRLGITTGAIGRRVLVFRETRSTNDVVLKLGEGGEPEGTVVFAETQSAGRGQFSRKWDSAMGLGLWFSILVRPRWDVSCITSLTPLVSVCVADALHVTAGVETRIKLPNDVYIGARKTAGILTEVRTGRSVFAAVGIGVNINHSRADFPTALQQSATSLSIEAGRPIDRITAARAILAEINRNYDADHVPSSGLLARYEALSRFSIYANF